MSHLTPAKIAARLGFTPEHVRQLIASGRLKASNVGNGRVPRWVVDEADLASFLNRRSTSAEPKQSKPSRSAYPPKRYVL